MKIRPLTDTIQSFTRVQSKEDKGNTGGERQQQNPQKDGNQNPETPVSVTPETVGAAIESFAADKQAQVNGLTAAMAGSGPGLRVVLRDGSGAIVRQMSGEEFLKLRETVSKDKDKRGKILDQKL